ncbi:gem-associated protein 5-like isoform X2 [Bombyx mandarina]|uniref:Gem-associated protein 5-like isoform X1 n=1 Tax=Bombyx mandarina TaxID=7092 RepID=A0A6J2JGT0_BOMMA|nr:gem-associated protein 5-like isoform X1 [Bombyx mandarina]XP_028028499.1 gem-associated protein 5-like isoform X2 [Bombyx mandarina]
MDESVLFPSPNWFQVSGLAISKDGWLVYSGPGKSLCIVEPLKNYNSVIDSKQPYCVHFWNRAHNDKIVSVDLSPEWPEKRCILTGAADGTVKQWVITNIAQEFKINSTHSHEVHHNEKEEVTGVGYSNEQFAITVGSFGTVVKWDLKSNVVKNYQHLLKSFKPVCMSCSSHLLLHVAVGTKQGVIFVLDLNGQGKTIYKVRGQDDEIMTVSWCPQYEVVIKKLLKESDKRPSVSERLHKIRNEPEPDEIEDSNPKSSENLEASGMVKSLPEDSFDESVTVEDDMFDIYKDHEADEFGHKKYQPEEIRVKIKPDLKQEDYLAECLKLKEQILRNKNETEESIESLVEALDKTHVSNDESHNDVLDDKNKDDLVQGSDHVHKHLLATIGKLGGVRIWSKTGKLIASCAVPQNKNMKIKSPSWPSLLWYKSNMLLIGDNRSQLLECNPLVIDCKNKLDWKIVHSLHKRGLYSLTTNAPRVQTEADKHKIWSVWSTSQDRNIIEYCVEKREKVAVHATCGRFVYCIRSCPYDAGKIAISVGDGTVRIWETNTLDHDDTKLAAGTITAYWQNVQGRVLTLAWHPTKENWLAFSTAESRVGILDTSGRGARALVPGLAGGVYSLCWGLRSHLYACASGQLVVYDAARPDQPPVPVGVEFEGQKWEISSISWSSRGFLVGSNSGGVAVLTHELPHTVTAAVFAFSKMIHSIDWHPQQTSNSNEESPLKDMIAVCSLDNQNTIIILEYSDKGDHGQLTTWKTLRGHKGTVFEASWNPHHDDLLLSTSSDATVRVWAASSGACVSVFDGHMAQSALGAAWSAYPQLATKALSGGGDHTLRLWDMNDFPAEAYDENKYEPLKKDKNKKEKKEVKKEDETGGSEVATLNLAAQEKTKSAKRFLLPILCKQALGCTDGLIRRMFEKYGLKSSTSPFTIERVQASSGENIQCDGVDNGLNSEIIEENKGKDYGADFIKIFGTIQEVNEVLDKEQTRHLELSNIESWMMLSIFRGHIDATIQYASQNDLLCPYLLSLTPCVSLKYWKDATQLYLAQIDRLVAKTEGHKLYENKYYGGPVYRKALTRLSTHDVRGAVATLAENKLYKEAYVLCRVRYMDSIATQILHQWANYSNLCGNFEIATVCFIALGDLSEAATVLAKSKKQENLCLAAEIAKAAGRATLADHIEKKSQNTIPSTSDETEEILKELPTKMELLLKQNNNSEDKAVNSEHEEPVGNLVE